jgi:hypothetical protein
MKKFKEIIKEASQMMNSLKGPSCEARRNALA